jgi:hypothetical protein
MDYRRAYNELPQARLPRGLEPTEARAIALQHALGVWPDRDFGSSVACRAPPTALCSHRGGAGGYGALLPFGPNASGRHVWLHREPCWAAWRAERKCKAIETLAGYGLRPST